MAEEMQHGDGQAEATKGHGVEPPDLGYAPPDPGLGESADSEIPVGVDSLTEEQKQKAQESAPSGDEGGEGGDDAIDVAAIMESGDADAAAAGDADFGAEGTAADEAGAGATERTEPEAAVAPDTGETA